MMIKKSENSYKSPFYKKENQACSLLYKLVFTSSLSLSLIYLFGPRGAVFARELVRENNLGLVISKNSELEVQKILTTSDNTKNLVVIGKKFVGFCFKARNNYLGNQITKYFADKILNPQGQKLAINNLRIKTLAPIVLLFFKNNSIEFSEEIQNNLIEVVQEPLISKEEGIFQTFRKMFKKQPLKTFLVLLVFSYLATEIFVAFAAASVNILIFCVHNIDPTLDKLERYLSRLVINFARLMVYFNLNLALFQKNVSFFFDYIKNKIV